MCTERCEAGVAGHTQAPGSSSSPTPPPGRQRCPWPQATLRGEEAGTDLGTLGLIEGRAADGRAHKHSAQGGGAAVMAGAVCDPGCPGLEDTDVG